MGLKLQISMDFILTILVFITLTVYFLFYLLSQRNVSIINLGRERKLTKALAISQILVNDYGEPKNWEEIASVDNIRRIGFLNESYNYPNYISKIKVERLNSVFCNDIDGYNKLKTLLGLNKENIIIIAKFPDVTYVCPSPSLKVNLVLPENITRKAFDSVTNKTVTLFVAVGDGG